MGHRELSIKTLLVEFGAGGWSVPGYGLLAAVPVEADVRPCGGGARARGAGLMTMGGGAVALIGRHTITAVAVEP